jgi:hypothetical protein
MTFRPALLLSVLALAAGAATVAAAPDPATGEVSAAAPTTTFAGSITEPTGAFEIYAQEQGTSKDNCSEPVCQEFALNVKDAGTLLAIESVVDEDSFSQTVEVEAPDGAITQTSAVDPGTVTAKLKNPKAGAYLIRIYGSDYINESPSWTYKATVKLTTASAAPAPAATPAPTTTAGGQAAPAPAATVRITAPKVSARKVARTKSIAIKLTASATVKNLQVSLATGKAGKPKLVGRARLATLEGTRTVKVKVKGKLKPGTLRITVQGTDSGGAPVSAQATARIRR